MTNWFFGYQLALVGWNKTNSVMALYHNTVCSTHFKLPTKKPILHKYFLHKDCGLYKYENVIKHPFFIICIYLQNKQYCIILLQTKNIKASVTQCLSKRCHTLDLCSGNLYLSMCHNITYYWCKVSTLMNIFLLVKLFFQLLCLITLQAYIPYLWRHS